MIQESQGAGAINGPSTSKKSFNRSFGFSAGLLIAGAMLGVLPFASPVIALTAEPKLDLVGRPSAELRSSLTHETRAIPVIDEIRSLELVMVAWPDGREARSSNMSAWTSMPQDLDASAVLPYAVAIGAGGLLLASLRLLKRRRHREAAPEAIAANQSASRSEVPSASESTATFVGDLAEAIGPAKIKRVLMIGETVPCCEGGVALARRLADRGASVVLADFSEEAQAARQMGSFDVTDDIVAIAASPTMFADGIQRDRRSRAHLIAATFDASDGRRKTVRDAAATTVAGALAEAYACSIIVLGPVSVADIAGMLDANCAVVVPHGEGPDDVASATAARLRSEGLSDIIFMTRRDSFAAVAAAA